MYRLMLYTRPGCHLCDAMKRIVDDIARDAPVSLREIDITGNAELERRLGIEIPVLAHGERIVARVRTTRTALLDSLRNEGAAPSARMNRSH